LIQWPARPAKNDSRQTSFVLDRFHQECDHQHVAVQLTNRKNVENVLGLLSLANVVARAVLTAPGPLNLIHAEVPNRMIGTFPFMFIPAFFVPLAVVLHVLAIRSIASHARTALNTPLMQAS
jgi:hypothetical protein